MLTYATIKTAQALLETKPSQAAETESCVLVNSFRLLPIDVFSWRQATAQQAQ
jgi:hypothetical protein